jgi:hypothetical protein
MVLLLLLPVLQLGALQLLQASQLLLLFAVLRIITARHSHGLLLLLLLLLPHHLPG